MTLQALINPYYRNWNKWHANTQLIEKYKKIVQNSQSGIICCNNLISNYKKTNEVIDKGKFSYLKNREILGNPRPAQNYSTCDDKIKECQSQLEFFQAQYTKYSSEFNHQLHLSRWTILEASVLGVSITQSIITICQLFFITTVLEGVILVAEFVAILVIIREIFLFAKNGYDLAKTDYALRNRGIRISSLEPSIQVSAKSLTRGMLLKPVVRPICAMWIRKRW